MTELAWMAGHELMGMSERALEHARARFSIHMPACECGSPISGIRPKTATCPECGRLYTRLGLGRGVQMMAHNTVLETVHVVFNGNVTKKTFTWEL